MTREQQIIDVVSAFMAGKAIECHRRGSHVWVTTTRPLWDFFIYEYRAASDTPDVYPWDAIHPDFKYAARDNNGDMFLYEQAPRMGGHFWVPVSGMVWRVDNKLIVIRGSADWKDSLVERPS
jgi:hypothetical protein